MTFNIGDTVYLKEDYAKVSLDHPEWWFSPDGNKSQSFDSDMKICMLCCMGVPIEGIIECFGADRYVGKGKNLGVMFKCGNLKMFCYIDPSDVAAKSN